MAKWTEGERKTLKANYARMTAAELAKMLGRTESAIWREASRLELPDRRVQWRTTVEIGLDVELRMWPATPCAQLRGAL